MDSHPNKQDEVRDAPSGPFFQGGSHSANPPRFREQPIGAENTAANSGAAGGNASSINRSATYGVTPSTLKSESATGWGQEVLSNIDQVRIDTPVSNISSTVHEVPTTVIASDGSDKRDGLPNVIGNAPPGAAGSDTRNESTGTGTGSGVGGVSGTVSTAAGTVAANVSDAVTRAKDTAVEAFPGTSQPRDRSADNQSAPFGRQGGDSSLVPETREPADPTAQNQSAPFTKQGDTSQGTGTVADTVGSAYQSMANTATQVYEKAATAAGDALDSISGDRSAKGGEGEARHSQHGGIPTSAGPPAS